jgi:hypothetical protein
LNFNITVVQVSQKTATSKAGKPYRLVELAYKNNTFQGKLEEAKINQYSKVFNEVSGMKQGEVYDVVKEKDDSGFYQWLEVKQAAPGSAANAPTPTATETKGYATPKSTYETPEERAKKQVYIIRQSSISAAINVLSVGAKTPPSTELILKEAQKYTDWVLNGPAVDLFAGDNDLPDAQVE